MSRVGKQPIKIAAGIKVSIADGLVKVEGPKGKLSHQLPRGVTATVDKDQVVVTPQPELSIKAPALHGLTRTLIHNMVHGVSTGFTKELDIVGVGYRATAKGQVLTLNVGFSHPIDFTLPTGIAGKVEGNTHLVLNGADKELLGMVAAKIRGFRPPEPYQGKGIKYTNEKIIRKQGKAAGAK
ncbi:MAG: 50S ribosomal protein L6 [Cryobacterium sp.]|nr:50S ribosomal protein L6 [Oligoflexia bacterium]